jgi:hypothetical protein
MLETASQPRKLLLKLDVDETNIDRLENASCEEIFANGSASIRSLTKEYPRSMSSARDMAIRPIAGFT